MAIIGALIGFYARRKFPRDRWVFAFIAAWVAAGLSVKVLEYLGIDLDEPNYAAPHEYVVVDLLGENGEKVGVVHGVHHFYPELLKAQVKVYNFYEVNSGKCESNLRSITQEQARDALVLLNAAQKNRQGFKPAFSVSITCMIYRGADKDCEERYKADPEAQRKSLLRDACGIKENGYGPKVFEFDTPL